MTVIFDEREQNVENLWRELYRAVFVKQAALLDIDAKLIEFIKAF